VARLASGKAAPTRLPSLPRPQKLQRQQKREPGVTLPRRRPAPPKKAAPAERSRAGRYAGISMVAVGMLILAYGTTTLVWQDPWTAWQTARAQDRAEVEYDKIVKDFRKSTGVQTKQATRAWLHRQAALFNLNTPEGEPVGKLSIPKIDVKFTIVQGTEEPTLAKGPAHYVETPLPGAKGKWTVGIAGHRTTYLAPFRRINELSPGDHVNIAMPYGRFYYAVEKTKIVDATNETVLAADEAITGRKPYNRLALTACHPPFSAAQRIIVYSRLLRYKLAKAPS
jgi:sortase A